MESERERLEKLPCEESKWPFTFLWTALEVAE
jgi:hypothetical protein